VIASGFAWLDELAALIGVGACLALCQIGCSGARYSAQDAPGIVMPAHFAEGSGEPGAVKGSASAKPAAATAPAASGDADCASGVGQRERCPPRLSPSTAPDPEPLRMAEQVEYELELAEGQVRVLAVRTPTLPSPVVTPRRMGRYAIELGIGQELLERVRFDFAATAGDEVTPGPKQPLSAPLTLSARAIARLKVRVPRSPRARRALLVDRALGTVTVLEWPLPEAPPKQPPAAAASEPPATSLPAAPVGR